MARKGQTFRKYSQEFRLEGVRLYEQEGLSYQAVAKQMGIPSNTQLKQWIKETLQRGVIGRWARPEGIIMEKKSPKEQVCERSIGSIRVPLATFFQQA